MLLPAGHTARAPRPDDEDALHGLVRDYTFAVTGVADYTLDDARDELTGPGFVAERDARFVFDRDGRLAGCGFVHRKGDGGHVDVDVVAGDVVAGDGGVRRWLLGWVLARARDGRGDVTVGHGCYRADGALRDALTEHGFSLATTFHRMRIDHVGPLDVPVPPDGVSLLAAGEDDGVRRAAHHVLTTAFADHFGFVRESYVDWVERHERRSGFAWSRLWVAELDGRPVGVLECEDRFAHDGLGYVASLGVVASARGRGIAKFLLRHAFAVDAAAGRTGTALHVDTDNVTPALGLYESVGMHPVLVIDAFLA